MKMYAAYLEHFGMKLIEIPHVGFASYSVAGNECYVANVYVEPKERRSGYAVLLVEQIEKCARENGCAILTCQVQQDNREPEAPILTAFKLGFKIWRIKEGVLIMKKDLANG